MIAIWWACTAVAPPEPAPDVWGPTDDGAQVYASCASCHLADGSGRPDGVVPRLAGQPAEILASKLTRIASGQVDLPVMLPFARALTDDAIAQVAEHIEGLPAVAVGQGTAGGGGTVYADHCAACHGAAGEGSVPLGAPRLCGQHHGYLLRRLRAPESRGDADAAMVAIVQTLGDEQLDAAATWLAACTP